MIKGNSQPTCTHSRYLLINQLLSQIRGAVLEDSLLTAVYSATSGVKLCIHPRGIGCRRGKPTPSRGQKKGQRAKS